MGTWAISRHMVYYITNFTAVEKVLISSFFTGPVPGVYCVCVWSFIVASMLKLTMSKNSKNEIISIWMKKKMRFLLLLLTIPIYGVLGPDSDSAKSYGH